VPARHYGVVICGGGPVGLTLSILLSRSGIRHLLLEARDGTSPIPRARGINHRTVEIWDRFGLTPDLERLTLPPPWLRQIVYQETLAGALIGAVPTPDALPGAVADLTPSDAYCISQDKTDALLRHAAASYPEATLRFGAELVDVRSEATGVAVEFVASDGTQRVRASWVVGCDGSNSRVRTCAGIANIALASMDSFVNAHFDADLRRWTAGREAPLLWNMQEGCEGVFGPLDGERFWRCQINFDPLRDPFDSWTPEKVADAIRVRIGAPAAELPLITLHSYYPHTVKAALAETFRRGHVLLCGDAAHQIPPHGAMGMNSGVQSAHNLAWKLALVVQGHASPALLDTYDIERREVATRVIDHAIGNFNRMKHVRERSTPAERRAAIGSARAYGNSLGLDLGVHYEQPGAFVPDGTDAPDTDDVTVYTPSAKPGYRAPHLWLERKDGTRTSTIALFDGAFTLLAGPGGEAWRTAAEDRFGSLRVRAYRIGDETVFAGRHAPFEDVCGIGRSGAVLVRPDGHVAFRSERAPDDPRASLAAVLANIGVSSPAVPAERHHPTGVRRRPAAR
jgi:putative polyketide hydroxylase